MDTDDLSRETYEGVILEAEKFHHDLTLQFGVMSYSCSDEIEFLDNAIQLIAELKKATTDKLSEIFFDDIPEKSKLDISLNTILSNIANIKEIPFDKRHFDF